MCGCSLGSGSFRRRYDRSRHRDIRRRFCDSDDRIDSGLVRSRSVQQDNRSQHELCRGLNVVTIHYAGRFFTDHGFGGNCFVQRRLSTTWTRFLDSRFRGNRRAYLRNGSTSSQVKKSVARITTAVVQRIVNGVRWGFGPSTAPVTGARRLI